MTEHPPWLLGVIAPMMQPHVHATVRWDEATAAVFEKVDWDWKRHPDCQFCQTSRPVLEFRLKQEGKEAPAPVADAALLRLF